MQYSDADEIALEREASAHSLADYTELAWPVLEPSQPFIRGWHIDAVSEHLMACAQGEITRLVINVPPGTSKSTTSAVMFPSWLWGPGNRPDARFLGGSFSLDNAARDNRKTGLLVGSDWFQSRWSLGLTKENETYIENEKLGFRQARPVASFTGKRGDFVVWDDPHSPEMAESEADRKTALRVFRETLPLRVNNPETSVIIIIMQRLHQKDVTGHILDSDYGYEHLMLPMEFEPKRKCYTSIGFEDPRTKEGESIDPVRFPPHVIARDKKVMTAYAVAGQFQQSPTPRGGGMFKREWFNIIPQRPAGYDWVRGWDLAGTDEEDDAGAAFTAGVLLGKSRDPIPRYCVAHAVRDQLSPGPAEKLVINTAKTDGPLIRGSLPQDPGQAGKAQVRSMIPRLSGLPYRASPESGDKASRALPFAAQCEIGNVDVVAGEWVEAYLDELCVFPRGKFADQVDATSRAFTELQNPISQVLQGRVT